ncbi:aspartyl-phosphate phosphatase Spo0E family protein [Mesobacillus zeae]|uniref:Aspartyl-phosphate phosphatase Spo0E family protein n=1 Tax=Mesobacillus zeae TaxID=1917180 RepID=A0A398B481_9BACI|nr:aspartyl-phosphate phosphatase Spo0E family protein [Mesobacillus zeae]RID82770.1 aspartyl-phosphate phosphatase Spo0E family protein [Mesobacillus zeae]
MCLNRLLEDIEKCRNEMVQLASHTPLSNQRVVDMSTKLDRLLNKYHSINGGKVC